ncbi:MAG: glycosyltransferase family 4 protein [Fibrobacterota bacterium]|nr:glycosyltransferase family 4 protein [Fibrobacterota bacterium]
MAHGTRKLSYYSYDSLGNPWLSGGGALRDFEILKRQRDFWSDIVIWTGNHRGFRAGEREGVRFRALGFGRSYLLSRLSFTLFANLRILFDRADALGNSLSAYAPMLAGLLRPGRFFMVAHHYAGSHSREKYSLLGVAAWMCEWLLYRFCRRMIVSNGKVAERIRAMNPRVEVLQSQNGFDSGLMQVTPGEAAPPFILFLGRFDIYMKGLDLLVSAFSALDPAVRGETRLVVAGAASPEALAAVAKLVGPELADKVRLAPNVSDAEKRELLRTCLFFCSPSRFEGWGIAALEANASGKPVLVTRADGFLDSIKDGYSGIMVPVDDGPALIAGMESLIRDDSLRRDLGANAREWASRFTWEGVAARERDWLGRVLGFSSNPPAPLESP